MPRAEPPAGVRSSYRPQWKPLVSRRIRAARPMPVAGGSRSAERGTVLGTITEPTGARSLEGYLCRDQHHEGFDGEEVLMGRVFRHPCARLQR